MNDENHTLLSHISQRIAVCKVNINRLKSDLEASNIEVGALLGRDVQIQEIRQFDSKDEINQSFTKAENLALLEKVDALEAEIVEIRMLYFHKEVQQFTRLSAGFHYGLREQSISLVKRIPPLFHILRKLRGIYILKKSRSLNAQENQINKRSK